MHHVDGASSRLRSQGNEHGVTALVTVSHYDYVPENGLGNYGWGNSYKLHLGKYKAPVYVQYAMRCEYPADVAPNCLCPEINSPDGGTCSKSVSTPSGNREWGNYDYSDSKYCWKLNVITNRPDGSHCFENAQCEEGLYCDIDTSDGNKRIYMMCPRGGCPDKRWSEKLASWGKYCACSSPDFPKCDGCGG